jgi:hypothetical protein
MNENAADSISQIDVGEEYSKTGLLGTNDTSPMSFVQRPEYPPRGSPKLRPSGRSR